MKLESPLNNVPATAIPDQDAYGTLDERALDGDFPIEGDGGAVDAGSQAHVPPPPPPAC